MCRKERRLIVMSPADYQHRRPICKPSTACWDVGCHTCSLHAVKEQQEDGASAQRASKIVSAGSQCLQRGKSAGTWLCCTDKQLELIASSIAIVFARGESCRPLSIARGCWRLKSRANTSGHMRVHGRQCGLAYCWTDYETDTGVSSRGIGRLRRQAASISVTD